ncbi:FimV family protein [Acidithiobacillus sp.]|uniref:type IV pilus assembly protein FimV n=1 Tax=Acidithiobacillus sp. TaxID=1872118 RepID=UPI0025B940DF|nr:FimV/HubP family polar landmark protein [Acidithiobacillus sp.]
MDRKAWVQVFLALGVGVPGLAQAMGLGDLIVLSGPGEPFRAEIPIRSEHPKELTGAQAGLAPASAFSLIHLPVDQTLSQWHFSVREGSQPAILISSPLPLTQASLPFLVQLDWSGGQIVREYRASSAAANTYGVPATRLAPPSSSPRTSARAMPYPPMPARPPRAEVAGWASAARYGPVPEHQTLFEIAQKLSRSNRVSLDQVMAALVKANPGAFKGGNPNMLYAGTYLRTPSLAQVQAMTPAQARAWLRAQAAGAAQARPTPAVASQTALPPQRVPRLPCSRKMPICRPCCRPSIPVCHRLRPRWLPRLRSWPSYRRPPPRHIRATIPYCGCLSAVMSCCSCCSSGCTRDSRRRHGGSGRSPKS